MNTFKSTLFFLFLILNSTITTANSPTAESSLPEELSLTATTSTTDGTCDLCNGSIDLIPIGGQAPYTYAWVTGATTEDVQDLCLGFYNYTITDDTGCTFTSGVFVDNTTPFQVNLNSQADVDQFVMNFGNCQEIGGSLRIGTTFSSPPSNITDISGLSNLTAIGGSLNIFQNPNLNSLEGLENIEEIGSSLHINSNNALTTIAAFQNLTELLGNFIIDNHTGLQDLTGFNNLQTVSGDVYISNNTDLVDITALSQLQYVDGDFDIRIALDLTNLNGLEQLEIIGGDLILRDNPNLTNIDALDHTITIEGDVTIENTALSNCSILPICNLILDGNTSFTLNNNNTGCNSETEISDACNSNTIDFTMQGFDPTCFGECDGYINLFQEGATPPITYNWSTGATGPSPNQFDLCPGIYTATITDAFGITAEASYLMGQPDLLTLEVDIVSMACFGECVGEMNYILTGGTLPYSAASANALCADEYEIMITDANGCAVNSTATIVETALLVVNIEQITDNTMGQSDGSIDINVSGGSMPLSYSWLLNGTEVSTEQNPSNLGEGLYTLWVSDAEGCSLMFGPYPVGTPTTTNDLLENEINISPNPAINNITITFPNNKSNSTSYSLWNANGFQIKNGQLNQALGSQIYVGDLTNGIYFLRLNDGDKFMMKKIIVNR